MRRIPDRRNSTFAVPDMLVPPLLEILFSPLLSSGIILLNFIVLATKPDPSYHHNNKKLMFIKFILFGTYHSKGSYIHKLI